MPPKFLTIFIPGILALLLWAWGVSLQGGLTCLALLFGFVYFVCPFTYYSCPFIRRQLLFFNLIAIPFFVDFDDPERYGIPGSRNYYVLSDHGISLGVWHILPEEDVQEAPKHGDGRQERYYQKCLKSGKPVVVYAHGTMGSRAWKRRIDIYRRLRSLDYHVITFDYRGYGDSSNVRVSETGVVKDTIAVVRHVRSLCGNSPILLWGHSLGSGVGCRAAKEMSVEGDPPTTLVLQAPFNHIHSAFRHFTPIWHWMPGYERWFVDRLASVDIEFDSERYIAQVSCPILILHAKDDHVVPYRFGKKLYERAVETRPAHFPEVRLVSFEWTLGHGHELLHKDPRFRQIIGEFVDRHNTNLITESERPKDASE